MPFISGPSQDHIAKASETKPSGAEQKTVEDLKLEPSSTPPLKSENSMKKVFGTIVDGWHFHNKVGRDDSGSMIFRTLILTIMNGAAGALYVVAFSAIGYGLDLFDYLSDYYQTSRMIVGGCCSLFLVLYLLDFSYWPTKAKILKYFFVGVILSGISVGGVLGASKYPQAPVGLFLFMVPGYIYAVKRFLFPKVGVPDFLENMFHSLSICCVSLIVVWITWFATTDQYWDQDTKVNYTMRIDSCTLPDYTSITSTGKAAVAAKNKLDKTHKWCMSAFLVWISPMILAMGCFMFGMICHFVSKALLQRGGKGIGFRLFVGFAVFCLIGIWVAASVAGAGMNVSNLVMSFMFVAMVLVGVILSSTIGFQSLKSKILEIPVVKTAAQSVYSDWIKAMFVLSASPIFVIYAALSFVNQIVRVRVLQNFITKDIGAEEERNYFTLICQKQIDAMRKWRWTSVLVKGYYWGLFFMLVQVGVAKGTYLFLSWLNETLEPLSLGVVTVIFYCVGLTMFLLPPVPGVPVYLAGGVILTNAAWQNGDGQMDYITAIVFTSAVCMCIKLNAIVVQQKGFGERMSDNKTVKTFVGVNSLSIRAIELILRKPGLDKAKIFILCGGPDWPVSVLTGILKLNVFQMLLGSLPVYFFAVLPCVCTGSFMLKQNPEDPADIWPSVFGCTLLVAAMLQSFAFAAAAYYVEKVAHDQKEQLMAKPLDQDVLEVESRNRARKLVYNRLTDWAVLPMGVRVVLVVGLLAMMGSCYIVNLYSTKCFAAFQVTDKIEDLKNDAQGNPVGKPWDVILNPWGWMAVYLLLVSCACLWIFGRWVKCKGKSKSSVRVAAAESSGDSDGEAIGSPDESIGSPDESAPAPADPTPAPAPAPAPVPVDELVAEAAAAVAGEA